MRPPMEVTGGKRRRPKSSVGFGSGQPRFGQKSAASRARGGARAHEQLEKEQAKREAEKQRDINNNLKQFYEAVKTCLDKPDDAIFNDRLDTTYNVTQAKRDNEMKNLFKKL